MDTGFRQPPPCGNEQQHNKTEHSGLFRGSTEQSPRCTENKKPHHHYRYRGLWRCNFLRIGSSCIGLPYQPRYQAEQGKGDTLQTTHPWKPLNQKESDECADRQAKHHSPDKQHEEKRKESVDVQVSTSVKVETKSVYRDGIAKSMRR